MKFGSVDDPSIIDFTLLPDHPDTKRVLNKVKDDLEDFTGSVRRKL